MHVLYAWIVEYKLLCFFVVAVLVEQLPPPSRQSRPLYRYGYAVAQFLVANWRRARDAFLIGAPPPADSLNPAITTH